MREFNSVLTAPNMSLEMICAGPVTSQHSFFPNGEHFLPSESCGEGHDWMGSGLEMARLASRIARWAVFGRRSVITSDMDVIWKLSKRLKLIRFEKDGQHDNQGYNFALATMII